MSAHTKIRKTFHLAAGAYAEVIINLHMVDPLDANSMIEKILAETDRVCQDYRILFDNREKVRLEAAKGLTSKDLLKGPVQADTPVIAMTKEIEAEMREEFITKPAQKAKAKA